MKKLYAGGWSFGSFKAMLFACMCLVCLTVLAERAHAQGPPGGSAGSGPPNPETIAPDPVGIDLMNGGRVGIDSAISIGSVDSPALELTEGGGGFGGTPLGGFHYTDGSYPRFSDFFVLGSRGVSNTFPDGTARNLPDGMALQGNTLVEGNGTRWNFASTGVANPQADRYLTTLVRPSGETLTYTYSSIPNGTIGGRLRSIKSSSGYQLNLEWDPVTGKLKKATLSNRRYAYCDPLSGACTGSYVWPSLSWSTDVSNNTVATTSGMRSVAYSQPQAVHVGGTLYEWTTKITSGAGIDRFYSVRGSMGDSWPRPLYYGRDTFYSLCNRTVAVWKVQEPGAVWNYNWQNACQGFGAATRTDPLGKVATRNDGSFSDELGRISTYTYIDQWGFAVTPNKGVSRVTSLTNPEGGKVTWDWGGYYGPQNLLSTTVTPKPGSTSAALTWTKGYPAGCTVVTNINCNKPTHEVDARGYRTDYTYDPIHGGVLTKTLPAAESGVRPQVRYTYQQLSAKVLTSSGALVNEAPIWKLVSTSQCQTQASCAGTADEVVTSYTYDDNLLVATETVRSGDYSASSTVTKTYDHIGNLVLFDGPMPGNADTTRYVYDELRRLIATMGADPDGVGPLPVPVTRTTYNGDNKPTLVETGSAADRSDTALAVMTVDRTLVVTYDVSGRKAGERTLTGSDAWVASQFSYDAVGRLECSAVRMQPATYNALPTSACEQATPSTTDTDDRITRNFYDAAGQLIKVQQGVGSSVQIDYVRYEYTANGKRKAVIDANGNRAEMTYDVHDRQTRWTFPSKTTVGAVDASDYEEYTYDANGNRKSLRKRDGQTISYSYDALNRVTVKDLPGADDVHYAYDLRGLQLEARIGSLTGMGLSNTYDGFGRLKSSTTAYGTPKTLEYEWDPNGNRTSIKHPDGVVFTYHYDGLNRLVGVKEHGTTEVVSLSYDAQGRRLGSTRSGVATSYGYDGVSRLTSLTDDLASSPNDVALTFGYNPASQIVSRGRDNDLYRFKGYVNVDRPYAANGLNQYTTAGPVAFCHDKNGNLTQDGTLAADGSLVPGTGSSYKYDVENRLIERRARVSSSCESIAYSGALQAKLDYDASGRLRHTWDGSTTMVNGVTSGARLIYDGDELVVEYNNLGEIVRRYVHGTGEDDPMLWYEGSTVSAATRRSIQTDHQGSVVSIADNTGAMLAINAYDEYGIPNGTIVGGTFVPTNTGRFQYTGQAWIPELGMYYYKARIYSPTLGRFLQVDPIGYDDQVNLYAYVANDPVNGTDFTGKKIEWLAADDPRYASAREQMMAYLSGSPTFNAEYQSLVDSNSTYYVAVTTQEEHSYNPESRTITINPTSGLRVTGGVQSPALGGGHEFSHAAQHDRDPARYKADTTVKTTATIDPDGTIVFSTPLKPEETRATKVESQIASELGEPQRTGYRDSQGSVPVGSPTYSCVRSFDKSC